MGTYKDQAIAAREADEATRAEDLTEADKLIHHWCCNESTALCGAPMTEAWIDESRGIEPGDCVVCVDLISADIECSPGCNDRMGGQP